MFSVPMFRCSVDNNGGFQRSFDGVYVCGGRDYSSEPLKPPAAIEGMHVGGGWGRGLYITHNLEKLKQHCNKGEKVCCCNIVDSFSSVQYTTSF